MFLNSSRIRKPRGLRQFMEEELILPTGPHEGEYFSVARQPFTRHWLDEYDSGRWSEMIYTGPSQSGKSLCGFVGPICHTAFELEETAIAAVPDLDLVKDKWERDIEPVIARTRYRELLPSRGAGAKGGTSKIFRFKNGVTLRFMTAGGKDKSVASFTSRFVFFTETDGFDTSFSTSDEGTKIAQIEARARAFKRRLRRIVKECTVSKDTAHTWHKYQNDSTSSRIVLPCWGCGSFVLPEREHFVGWQEAQTSREAQEKGQFCCPACGVLWTEEQRLSANRKSVLVHAGQHVDDHGSVIGPLPDTQTLGFRSSAVHNCLLESADFAFDEWAARRSNKPELAEREMKQFVWTLPVADDIESIELDPAQIAGRRVANMPKGYVPLDTEWITIGVDVNKPVLHWAAVAWRKNRTAHVFDYGKQGIPHAKKGFAAGVAYAIAKLAENVPNGWTIPRFTYGFCDSRWMPEEVCNAIRALNDPRWFPSLGQGDGHAYYKKRYNHPKESKEIIHLGANYHVKRYHGLKSCFLDANAWKTELQTMLQLQYTPEDGFIVEGGLTLFDSSDANEHTKFTEHLTSEVAEVEYRIPEGYRYKWKSRSKANHWLDALCYACVAGHLAGFRVMEEPEEETQSTIRPFFHRLELPDGRSFSVYDRDAA